MGKEPIDKQFDKLCLVRLGSGVYAVKDFLGSNSVVMLEKQAKHFLRYFFVEVMKAAENRSDLSASGFLAWLLHTFLSFATFIMFLACYLLPHCVSHPLFTHGCLDWHNCASHAIKH